MHAILRLACLWLWATVTSCGQETGAGAADWGRLREQMVAEQLESPDRGIKDRKVLEAMRKVPRHEFVPPAMRARAYEDRPLPIGHGQTISQPYIVAYMTEQLGLRPGHRVLEIGTGSGYQAAILAELVKEVYSIEIVAPLGRQAEETLKRLGYKNVHVRVGDGYKGWPEEAPFDAVIVTCAPEAVPQPLVDQLKVGGRMIIPVGGKQQMLYVMERNEAGLRQTAVLPVRFVPMTGQSEESSRK